jgi:23S rRNA pseudouridine1911/1915/1917 synthase
MFKTQYHKLNPIRIDKFLAEFLQNTSRQAIQELIANQLVYKNSKIVKKPKELVSLGDIITIHTFTIKKDNLDSQESDLIKDQLSQQVKIIFEHKYFLIVDKPAGLLVHKTNNINSYSLVDFIIQKYPEIKGVLDTNQNTEADLQNRYGIVHRIDKDTSGLIVIARNVKALIELKKLFKDRKVYKEYTCLARGIIKDSHGNIKYPIIRSRLNHTKRVAVTSDKQSNDNQRVAHTEYWVLERYNNSTLLKVVIHTGRTHQIRVHLHSIGHPIIGDKLYGGKLEQKDKNTLNRQFLHASKLKFEYLGQQYEFNSDLAEDLQLYLKQII